MALCFVYVCLGNGSIYSFILIHIPNQQIMRGLAGWWHHFPSVSSSYFAIHFCLNRRSNRQINYDGKLWQFMLFPLFFPALRGLGHSSFPFSLHLIYPSFSYIFCCCVCLWLVNPNSQHSHSPAAVSVGEQFPPLRLPLFFVPIFVVHPGFRLGMPTVVVVVVVPVAKRTKMGKKAEREKKLLKWRSQPKKPCGIPPMLAAALPFYFA